MRTEQITVVPENRNHRVHTALNDNPKQQQQQRQHCFVMTCQMCTFKKDKDTIRVSAIPVVYSVLYIHFYQLKIYYKLLYF